MAEEADKMETKAEATMTEPMSAPVAVQTEVVPGAEQKEGEASHLKSSSLS